MTIADKLTVEIRVVREGLLLHIWNAGSNRLISTVNLQEKLGLTDERAQQLLAQLDEREDAG